MEERNGTGSGEAAERGTDMKKILMLTLVLLAIVAIAVPASAANVFLFTEKSITLFEGESVETALRREGNFDGEGEIAYSSSNASIASVAEDGTVTAVSKGQATISASLSRGGKRLVKAQATVKVLRAVKKVTLNVASLSVYEPTDPAVTELLKDDTENRVLVVPAGATVSLRATCTPEDASNRNVKYETTDAGVAKVAGTSLKAMQRGECDLTVASAQNPEVTEVFRVLVIQPVKKITINAGNKKVSAGSTLQLSAECQPENASIKDVTWSSKNPGIATVDASGVVTGLQKGNVTITATAADGSKVVGSAVISVLQPVTSLSFTTKDLSVVVGRTVQARVSAQPVSASDKTVDWSSSDETIATVKNGVIKGVQAGVCSITATSRSNPEVSVSADVTVKQLITKIECVNDPAELNLLVGQSQQLYWKISPDDATIKALNFKSQHRTVVTVDSNGVVTAVGRGLASVYAVAQDGSGKQGAARINVIQPVTGVHLNRDVYLIQLYQAGRITAYPEPKNANNQRVTWFTDNEGVATARGSGTSTASVYGVSRGSTYITTQTEDGGYTATAELKVDDFNGAIIVDSLNVRGDYDIRVTLKNVNRDIIVRNVYFTVECFDLDGNPMVCNTDGVSCYFNGSYPFELGPYERSNLSHIRFSNYNITEPVGGIRVTITGWKDPWGYDWEIPEGDRKPQSWYRFGGGSDEAEG